MPQYASCLYQKECIWGNVVWANEAPDFCWLHKNKNCAFSLTQKFDLIFL